MADLGPTFWLGVAGLTSTAAVSIGGLMYQFSNAKAERTHREKMARDERTYHQRVDAYEALLVSMNRLADTVERTHPVLGPGPEPPEPPTDEEVWAASAKIAAHGSPEVSAILKDVDAARRGFYAEAWLLSEIQQQPAGTKPSDTKASYGATKTEQWMKLEAARKSFREGMRRIEAAINEELHGINQ